MFNEHLSRALNKDKLIDWLEEVMQPVEPSRRFLRRLRARMVLYQGGRTPSGWLLAVTGGVILVIIAVSLGLALRLLLGLSSLFGLRRIQRKRRKKDQVQPTTT